MSGSRRRRSSAIASLSRTSRSRRSSRCLLPSANPIRNRPSGTYETLWYLRGASHLLQALFETDTLVPTDPMEPIDPTDPSGAVRAEGVRDREDRLRHQGGEPSLPALTPSA
eukprot:2341722-Rhodomonas_salina.1